MMARLATRSTSDRMWVEQEHRAIARQLAEQSAQAAHLYRIEAAGRLVEDQHRRIGQQRIGQADPLAVAPGQLADQPAPLGGEAAGVDDGVDARAHVAARHALGAGAKGEQLADAHVRPQRRRLGEISDPRDRIGPLALEIEAVDARAPLVGIEKACENAHGRGLTGAVRADEADHLATLDGERDSPQHAAACEAFAKADDLDHPAMMTARGR